MEFNSLDAQREAGEAYIASQRPADVVGRICLAWLFNSPNAKYPNILAK
jgi:hypothetical protein